VETVFEELTEQLAGDSYPPIKGLRHDTIVSVIVRENTEKLSPED
jgi:hypothetical protein